MKSPYPLTTTSCNSSGCSTYDEEYPLVVRHRQHTRVIDPERARKNEILRRLAVLGIFLVSVHRCDSWYRRVYRVDVDDDYDDDHDHDDQRCHPLT
jgi:hypothetical protein